MPSKSYKECRYPLVAALSKLTTHGFTSYVHHIGNCAYCHNNDGSYILLFVGDSDGVPMEDHVLPDGSWRYPPTSLFVIAHEFLPEYINLKE